MRLLREDDTTVLLVYASTIDAYREAIDTLGQRGHPTEIGSPDTRQEGTLAGTRLPYM